MSGQMLIKVLREHLPGILNEAEKVVYVNGEDTLIIYFNEKRAYRFIYHGEYDWELKPLYLCLPWEDGRV